MLTVHCVEPPTTICVRCTIFSILPIGSDLPSPSESIRERGIREARARGRQLVHDFGIEKPEDINVLGFAQRLGAEIVEARLDGFEAQLTRTADRVEILLNEAITDPMKRGFNVAHEIGHLVQGHLELGYSELPRHQPGFAPPRRRNDNERDFEFEANAIASELLLPRILMRRYEGRPLDMDLVREIAETFSVSVLTAAIRVVELSAAPCAAVFSQDGRVNWAKRSSSFAYNAARGKALVQGSLAWDFFATGELDARALPVPPRTWFSRVDPNAVLMEHAIASIEHGTVLSLLWFL